MRLLIIGLTLLSGCMSSPHRVDLQGHRGARGLYPENTIEGMLLALSHGMTTLEMDVVISRDSQVVVSHEPFFSHEISTTPDGVLVDEATELSHNIFALPYADIQQYDVGLRPHSRFPSQKKVKAIKPTLSALVNTVENINGYTPYYNIEIKRKPAYDSIYHPDVATYAQLVVSACERLGIIERTTIQSFDIGTLQYVHEKYPDIRLAYLIENTESLADNLETLGFTPDIYSPYYKLVTEDMVSYCKSIGLSLIPWTVNEAVEMEHLLTLGVDGIITDYPDRLSALIDGNTAYARIN